MSPRELVGFLSLAVFESRLRVCVCVRSDIELADPPQGQKMGSIASKVC